MVYRINDDMGFYQYDSPSDKEKIVMSDVFNTFTIEEILNNIDVTIIEQYIRRKKLSQISIGTK